MNGGVNPSTNKAIVPAYGELTTAHNVIYGNTSTFGPTTSIVGSGLGWFRMSYEGHDVRNPFSGEGVSSLRSMAQLARVARGQYSRREHRARFLALRRVGFRCPHQ